jgi:leucyl aminopeptidase
MEIKAESGKLLDTASDLAILGCFEGEPLPAEVAGLLEPGDFRASASETLLLYPRGGIPARRLLLVGLGKRESAGAEAIRRASATAVKEAQRLQVGSVAIGLAGELALEADAAAQAFAEGAELGAYRFLRYRTEPDPAHAFEVRQARVFARSDRQTAEGIRVGQTVARGVALARDLVNGPGYSLTPPALGDEAVKLGKQVGLKVSVLDETQLADQGFGGILAVGKGSAHPPRFIIMEYGQSKAATPTLCLVGKGLTFDSGGLSLKPPEAMETMKSDMGGSAAVFGAMQAVAELKLPLHVVGLVAAAENMPSSDAYRPGDIVRTLSGKTIEVLNTDAEGRIILADALFYAQRYQPEAIVELSTLTGAVIIALGSHASGVMGTSQQLVDRLRQAGEVSGERVWQLPLWPEYQAMVKSEIADLKNLAGRPAGTITAGAFLAEFVGDIPFAHLDIAGTAWVDRPARPYEVQGGTGVGVRLLAEFLREYN